MLLAGAFLLWEGGLRGGVVGLGGKGSAGAGSQRGLRREQARSIWVSHALRGAG